MTETSKTSTFEWGLGARRREMWYFVVTTFFQGSERCTEGTAQAVQELEAISRVA